MSEAPTLTPADAARSAAELDASIRRFAGRGGNYYARVFKRIHDSTSAIVLTFNWVAALFGPFWAATRGLWGFFWTFLLLETIAWVQIGRGAWGDLGGSLAATAAAQLARAHEFADKAAAARKAGLDATGLETLARNLERAAQASRHAAEVAASRAATVLIVGLALLAVFKLIQGLCANPAYERAYSRWRIDPAGTASGASVGRLIYGVILIAVVVPLTVYRFTGTSIPHVLTEFPSDTVLFTTVANWLGDRINGAAIAWSGGFDTVVAGVRSVLNALKVALMVTPWPVVMVVICVSAWRLAGARVAIFTAASLAYIAVFGYWEVGMETVALVGAGVVMCLVIGIPLGIWFGKSARAHRIAEPVLDLMQTLPAFVYLIPIIAFFGTGNPPGILATIIFGMPPVIRLTALGIRGVPADIKEAATAFGASRWQLLRGVEVPLALPSILTGINQTILMCLSMVVIISLIGGGGLGEVILRALQYAAIGPGLLGGFAILFLAMVMDRIVQGAFRRRARK